MSSSDFLIQATLKRLSVRIDTLMKDGPGRVQQELKNFYEEVIAEADRMNEDTPVQEVRSPVASDIDQPQERVDRLRQKVAAISSKLETMPR